MPIVLPMHHSGSALLGAPLVLVALLVVTDAGAQAAPTRVTVERVTGEVTRADAETLCAAVDRVLACGAGGAASLVLHLDREGRITSVELPGHRGPQASTWQACARAALEGIVAPHGPGTITFVLPHVRILGSRSDDHAPDTISDVLGTADLGALDRALDGAPGVELAPRSRRRSSRTPSKAG